MGEINIKERLFQKLSQIPKSFLDQLLFLKTSEFFDVYSQQVYLHLWDVHIVISQSDTKTEQE